MTNKLLRDLAAKSGRAITVSALSAVCAVGCAVPEETEEEPAAEPLDPAAVLEELQSDERVTAVLDEMWDHGCAPELPSDPASIESIDSGRFFIAVAFCTDAEPHLVATLAAEFDDNGGINRVAGTDIEMTKVDHQEDGTESRIITDVNGFETDVDGAVVHYELRDIARMMNSSTPRIATENTRELDPVDPQGDDDHPCVNCQAEQVTSLLTVNDGSWSVTSLPDSALECAGSLATSAGGVLIGSIASSGIGILVSAVWFVGSTLYFCVNNGYGLTAAEIRELRTIHVEANDHCYRVTNECSSGATCENWGCNVFNGNAGRYCVHNSADEERLMECCSNYDGNADLLGSDCVPGNREI